MSKIYESTRAIRDSIPASKTITLVGGSFDLLHVGHLHLLEYSKKLGGLLVVCVLSDSNVKSYKSPTRPIIGEVYRANMVAALRCVDRVYISDVGTSHHDTLSVVQPDRMVYGIEGTDQWRETVRKRELRLATHFPNIKIHYLERFSDKTISTSNLIQKILDSSDSD